MAVESRFASVFAQIADDPVFREFARPDAALLLWDLEGARLLWTSPSAVGLRVALEDEGGNVSAFVPARMRLRALGQGLAPASGARLERLRLDRGGLTPPVTCACRRVTLPTGEGALLTAIVGPVPKLTGAGAARSGAGPAALANANPETAPPPESDAPHPELTLEAVPPQRPGAARFLWHTDQAGRFTFRSDSLAEAVGPAGASIVGRTWDEIEGELVLDPQGGVSELLARGNTWSGRTVLWRIAGTDRAIAVNLAGAPVFGRKREFLGFRGFGLLRTDALAEWNSAAPPKGRGHRRPRLRSVESRDAPSEGPESPAPADRVSVISSRNVEQPVEVTVTLPLRESRRPEQHFPHLSTEERNAFREIARALGARFESGEPHAPTRQPTEVVTVNAGHSATASEFRILDSLPVGLLVYRGETLLFASRYLLDLTGYADLATLTEEGGLARLFPGRASFLARGDEDGPPLVLSTLRNESIPVDVRLTTLQWAGLPATALTIRRRPDNDAAQRLRALELELRGSDARLHELASVLDTATDGVIILDDAARILSLNRSAEALFGYDQREVAGENVAVLLASESQGIALEYLDGLRSSGVARLLNDGREVLGRVRQGGAIPLFMTVGRASEAPERKFCVVLRDVTALKKAEAELHAAKRVAQEVSAERSDFLAKVSHELRTPLNAIIGFAEVMLDERFGAIGNERYKDYLKDIHESGRRVIGLVTDLLDLAKIEAGRMELAFAGVNLNDIVASCVGTFLQKAARDRIVIRTSFAPQLPSVIADQRSVRQIVGNIISNAVKFTRAGGQVIVSTAITDRGEVAVRVRDTGIGMTEQQVEAALEPLRQLTTSRKGGGSGLGLPLAKAMIEANRGALHITSTPNEGTLVEIVFPPTRVLAQQGP